MSSDGQAPSASVHPPHAAACNEWTNVVNLSLSPQPQSKLESLLRKPSRQNAGANVASSLPHIEHCHLTGGKDLPNTAVAAG